MNDNSSKTYNEYNNENENYDALVLAAKHFSTGKNKSMCYISGNCKWWGEFWNVSSVSSKWVLFWNDVGKGKNSKCILTLGF